MIIRNELYKAAIQYYVGQVVREAVYFTVILAFIFLKVFSYHTGWTWYVISCVLLVWLYYSGKEYKKRRIELSKTIDRTFEYKKRV